MTRPTLIPRTDYDRIVADRDFARAHLDRALTVLSAIGRLLQRHTPADSERAAFDALWALLAEHGKEPGHEIAVRHAEAYARWEGKR